MNIARTTLVLVLVSLATTAFSQTTDSEQKEESAKKGEEGKKVKLVKITLARGTVELKVPETWQKKQPRSRIIEREFAVPPAKGDETPGRLTMMPSGGSVTQNVERWFGQFTQPDKKPTKEVAKVEKKKINDQEVVIVDISGTFKDRQGGGPFAGGKVVERKDYRMLGGIIQAKNKQQYFFKLYGPKKTIDSAAKSFMSMMESVKSK